MKVSVSGLRLYQQPIPMTLLSLQFITTYKRRKKKTNRRHEFTDSTLETLVKGHGCHTRRSKLAPYDKPKLTAGNNQENAVLLYKKFFFPFSL